MPLLRADQQVGVCCPARPLTNEQREHIRSLLVPVAGVVVYGLAFEAVPDRVFAAPDDLRLAELQALVDDPRIGVIWAARGGWGSARVVDGLNLAPLQQHPKWLVGFSDLTTLHLAWQAAGCASLHAPVLTTATADDVHQVLALCRGATPPPLAAAADALNRQGEATAPLVGGNLSLLAHSLGSRHQPDPTGKILVLEEVDEYEYRIDRLLVQLRRAGLLEGLAGLAVGQFSRLPANDPPFGADYRAIVREHTAHTAYPIGFGLPFGHEGPNRPMVLGGPSYRLEVGGAQGGTVLACVQEGMGL